MNTVYNREQLEAKKRPQLWAICETLGLPKHASNAKCVEAIMFVQPIKVEIKTEITSLEVDNSTVVYAEEVAIAAVVKDEFTASSVVMVGGSGVHYALSVDEALEYIKNHYKRGTLPVSQPTEIDEQAIAQMELNTYIEEQSEIVAPTIQILEQHNDEYVVVNTENRNHYIVRPNHPDIYQRCECPHCYYKGAKCKHQLAVADYRQSINTLSLKSKAYKTDFLNVGKYVAVAASVVALFTSNQLIYDLPCHRGGSRIDNCLQVF
jgi:hypothetical protein